MGAAGSDRLRANGTVVQRNDFVGRPIKRLDTRLQRISRPPLGAVGSWRCFKSVHRGTTGATSPTSQKPPVQAAFVEQNLSYGHESALGVPPDVLSHEPRRREGQKTTIFIFVFFVSRGSYSALA